MRGRSENGIFSGSVSRIHMFWSGISPPLRRCGVSAIATPISPIRRPEITGSKRDGDDAEERLM
ncbi:hypothetical protein GCM10027027_21520 [Neomicrococcus lactis]